jgi:type IV pilus assembly protein PilM
MTGSMGGGGGATVGAQADVSNVKIDGPKGPGWVIEIKGHHFFNDPKDRRNAGPAHVRNTLLRNLEHGSIEVPTGPGQPLERFTHKELGLGFAILALDPPIRKFQIANPNFVAVAGGGGGEAGFGGPMDFGGAGARPGDKAADKADPDNPEFYMVPRYDFIVQFCWQEKPLNTRIVEKRLKELEAQKAAELAAANVPAAPAANAASPSAAVTVPVPAVPAVSPTPAPATATATEAAIVPEAAAPANPPGASVVPAAP